MPTVAFNYGTWYFWQDFPMKVTFDGENKLIILNENETEFDVEEDFYSNWKEWVQYLDNSKFPQAMSTTGGDPTTGVNALGKTFFLENGWKIKPVGNVDKSIIVTGNLFTRDGSDPYLSADTISVSIRSEFSNLVDFIDLDTVAANNIAIAVEVWGSDLSNLSAGTAGFSIANTESIVSGMETTLNNVSTTVTCLMY